MILDTTVFAEGQAGGHLCREVAIQNRGSLKLKVSKVADPAHLGSQAEWEKDIRAHAHDMDPTRALDAEMAAVAVVVNLLPVHRDMLAGACTTGMQKGWDCSQRSQLLVPHRVLARLGPEAGQFQALAQYPRSCLILHVWHQPRH